MTISGGICVVAGEASGDVQVAPVLKALKAELAAVGAHDIPIWGAAGPHMRAMGVEALVRTEDLAVMAFSEVVPAYFRVREAYEVLLAEIEKRRPLVVVLVDYPGFNLKFARDAYQRGNTVLYHIAPKVWAHGWNRVQALSSFTHLVTCILPFEEKIFRDVGINAFFVGNPLCDAVRDFRLGNGTSTQDRGVEEVESSELPRPVDNVKKIQIAVLPGSRKSELIRLVPLYLKSLYELEKRFSSKLQTFVLGRVPVAPTLSAAYVTELFDRAAEQAGISQEWLKTHVTFEKEATYKILSESDYCWVCSGTAALEVGFFAVPNSVAYRISLASALIIKATMCVPYVSLSNLCARREIVPEYLQFEATVENLVNHAMSMLSDKIARRDMVMSLEGLERLFPPHAALRTAQKMSETILANLIPEAEKYRKHEQVRVRLLSEAKE